MQCVNCGRDAGYNRAVIELFSGTTIGGLCMNCEKDELGRSFRYCASGSERRCAFCKRDGQIRFPRYVPELTSSDGDLVVTSSIEDDETVPCLCDEHFHELIEDDERLRSVKR